MKRVQIACMVALAGVLAGCGGGGDGDELQKWMADQRNLTRPKIVPIAEPKVFKPQQYAEAASLDPFNKDKLTRALQRDGGPSVANSALVVPGAPRGLPGAKLRTRDEN